MFKKFFNRNKTIDMTGKLSLRHGEVLRLIMRDGEKREVTIIVARKNSMRVKEFFHGIYDLQYDEIMLVYQGNNLYTFMDLKKSAACVA